MAKSATAKSAGKRIPWFDEASETPLIGEYAKKLASFLEVVSDGRVDAKELDSQEKRVVHVMRELEPLLSDEAHEKVTELLCEVTAYDLMNTLHMAAKARTSVKFRG